MCLNLPYQPTGYIWTLQHCQFLATVKLDSHVFQVAAHLWSKLYLTLLSATRFDLHDDTHAL